MNLSIHQPEGSRVSVGVQAPDAFEYLDYRKYLAAYYQYRKALRRDFSYRLFSQRTGMESPNYLKLIIDGDRNLTSPHAKRVARYCGLEAENAKYFLHLVQWSQSKRVEEREVLWTEILRLRSGKNATELPFQHLELLSQWQAIAIMEMLRLPDFEPTYEYVKSRVRFPLEPSTFESCLAGLIRAGLIRNKNGKLRVVNSTLVTNDEIPSRLIRDYHDQIIRQGLRALEGIAPGEREFISTTVPVRKKDLPKLKAEMKRFRDLVLELTNGVADGDEIYQMNIQFFPLTETKRGNK